MAAILIPGKRATRWTAAARLGAVNRVKQLGPRTEESIRLVAAEVGCSGRQLYRWLRRFDEVGERGLADSRRRDRGRPKLLRFPEAALFIVLHRAKGSTIRAIHKSLRREWPRLHPGFGLPSYAMVRSLIKSIETAKPDAVPS
jgi:transposase-like protein